MYVHNLLAAIMILLTSCSLSACTSLKGAPQVTEDATARQVERVDYGWLQYGPAIINSSKRVDLISISGFPPIERRLTLVQSDQQFQEVKSLIFSKLGRNLAFCCPLSEDPTLSVSENTLILYANEEGGDWETMPFISETTTRDVENVLLVIPLTPLTLGQDYKEAVQTICNEMGGNWKDSNGILKKSGAPPAGKKK